MFDRLFSQLEESEARVKETDVEWDAFVDAHPHGSLLQTSQWATLKEQFGWTSRRIWLKKEGKLVAGAQILFRSAPLKLFKIGYIPHGPLVDWQDEEQVAVLFNQISHACFEHRAGFVKMEPMVWETEESADIFPTLAKTHNLVTNTDSIQPPRTVLVSLQGSEDDILARMKSKTRYNVRLAAKKGVTVRQGTDADLPIFAQLMQATAERNAFGIHEPAYYETVYNLFAPTGKVALFISEFEGQPLSAIMAFAQGKRGVYQYGASSNEHRKLMPTYAMQWAAMKWAKEKGCTYYDLDGVPDEDEATLEAGFQERNDGLWGVYRAKRGWGGSVVRTVGTADLVLNKRTKKLYDWRKNRNQG